MGKNNTGTRVRSELSLHFPAGISLAFVLLGHLACSSGGGGGLSDGRLLDILTVLEDVDARVEQLLIQNPSPSKEDLLQAVREVPGVGKSGLAIGPSAAVWLELGQGGPLQYVMMDPYPEMLPAVPVPPRPQAPAPAPGQGDGKRYGYFSASYPSATSTQIISLLNEKKYERIMATVADLQTLRNLGRLKVLYYTAHSLSPDQLPDPDYHGPIRYGIQTQEALPPHPKTNFSPNFYPPATRDDIAANRVGFFSFCNEQTKLCKDVWFFNDLFVERYISFGDDSLFFLDSCSSAAPEAAEMQRALFGNNLSVFVGWSEPVWVQRGWEIANIFFDRWLGTNHVEPVPDPPQRPFDAESVRAELEKEGNDTAPAKGFNAKLTILPRPGGGKVAGAPSIQLIQVKEKDKEMKIGGIFGKDPGSDRRKVKLAGQALEVKEWKEEEITCTLPKSSGGSQVDVEIIADDHEGNKVQITEWTVKFTHEGHSEFKDKDTGEVFASSDGKYTFDVKFRADVHEYREEAGQEPMNKVIVPFEIEDDGSMSWSGTARFQDQTQPFSGTTSNLYDIDYTSPDWPGNLPQDTDLLAGEGYIDMNTKKLYLFLVGVGDDSGSGTYNLGTQTDCQYEHDQYTNRVYLVFNLDENFEIENNSCTDQITDQDGQFTYNGTRSWEFTTRSPPDKEAAR